MALGPVTGLPQAAAYQSQRATAPRSVQAARPTAGRTAPHSGHPRIVSIRIRTRRPRACPHRPVLRAPARHLGGPPLSRGARSGAGAWLAAGVTGSSGWTQRSGSHLRRGRADTDAHDRRLPHADADQKERYRRHGRGNDRVLTRTPATRSAGSCGGRTRRRWRPRSARSCATRCQRAGGCRGPGSRARRQDGPRRQSQRLLRPAELNTPFCASPQLYAQKPRSMHIGRDLARWLRPAIVTRRDRYSRAWAASLPNPRLTGQAVELRVAALIIRSVAACTGCPAALCNDDGRVR